MIFAHDTEFALGVAAALVNTAHDGDDLVERTDLDAFLTAYPYTGRVDGDEAELRSVRALRAQVRAIWETTERDHVVAIVNELLRESHSVPYLARHDSWDWHLHVTEPDAPLADRMAAETAMAVADVIRADDLGRLRICAAPDCDAVLVDLSRNRSKRYCDTGNCGNRQHVAAYRARQASS